MQRKSLGSNNRNKTGDPNPTSKEPKWTMSYFNL